MSESIGGYRPCWADPHGYASVPRAAELLARAFQDAPLMAYTVPDHVKRMQPGLRHVEATCDCLRICESHGNHIRLAIRRCRNG